MIGVVRPRNWIDFVLYKISSVVVSFGKSFCIASWFVCVSSLGESEGGGEEDEAVAIDDQTNKLEKSLEKVKFSIEEETNIEISEEILFFSDPNRKRKGAREQGGFNLYYEDET